MAVYKPKEKILTAGQLCQWWGISTGQLDKLRLEKGLPYAVVGKGMYVFLEKSLVAWLKREEVVVEVIKKKRKVRRKRSRNYQWKNEHWTALEKRVARRDRHKCQRCGDKANLSIHHIKPRSQGGRDESRNLITLCSSCHDYVELEEVDRWDLLKCVK